MDKYNIVIVGAGAAGVSAALGAWEAGCKSILLTDTRAYCGGVLPQCCHRGFNLPNLRQDLTGQEYFERLSAPLSKTGVTVRLNTTVTEISPEKTATLLSEKGAETVSFDQIILATGCREKTISSVISTGTRPAGIFTAGQVQELINIYKQVPEGKIAILGSGDLGFIISYEFNKLGRPTTIIEKESHYTALEKNYKRYILPFSPPILYFTEVVEICGDKRISGVRLYNRKSREETFLPCDALVTAVGMVPEQTLLSHPGSRPWIHLCGNCRQVHKLIGSVAAQGKLAGEKAASMVQMGTPIL